MEAKRQHRSMTGVVTSDKMDKTVVVKVERRVMHRAYKKYVLRHSTFKAHDPQNACKVGDTVVIQETRPISKGKQWQVHKVLARASEI